MCLIINDGYIGDKFYFEIVCDDCGDSFVTQNENDCFCSKKCYDNSKYEWEDNYKDIE
jgi:endogenous inhibitor of DNA gyrase (YacG/DUF329 family)